MNFTAQQLPLPGIVLISPRRFVDSRGWFMETYRMNDFESVGISTAFVQDNQAFSLRAGTIRGLHFQKPPHAQAKLVRVLKGAIFDVAVDLRSGSRTFGRWIGATLTAAGGEQFFVPRGFAHGYCTLEDNSEVAYECDAYFDRPSEGGVQFSDPMIGIEWPFAGEDATVSEKDLELPLLRELKTPF